MLECIGIKTWTATVMLKLLSFNRVNVGQISTNNIAIICHPEQTGRQLLEGAICQIVIAKFILYRRDNNEYGVMHELGRDILVLKKGGMQEKPLLRFPSMGEVESNTLAAGLHSNSNRTLSNTDVIRGQ